MNIRAKAIKLLFITYPVRLSDVPVFLTSAITVWLKVLAGWPMALASEVQVLALMVEALALRLALTTSLIRTCQMTRLI